MSVTQNKQAAFKALNKFANSRVQLIEEMIKAGYNTAETARDVVIEWLCDKTGATFNVSKSGKVMLDSKHEKYNTTKQALRDIMLMLQGTTRHAEHAKHEPVDEVAQLLKKIAKLTPADKRRLLKGINA
jgi:polyhydroxyalkanoate synthesis regulator phasin